MFKKNKLIDSEANETLDITSLLRGDLVKFKCGGSALVSFIGPISLDKDARYIKFVGYDGNYCYNKNGHQWAAGSDGLANITSIERILRN